MNQDQRKFLQEKLKDTYRRQRAAIEARMPTAPSLNNYLIAAFLDNSIQFNDINKLKVKMRETVLRMGHTDKLIDEERSSFYNRRERSPYVQIIPEDLFIIPKPYIEALDKYKAEKAIIDKELADLEAQYDTITLKVQIGSNASLDRLVENVDNLIDLTLVNAQLMLKENNQPNT